MMNESTDPHIKTFLKVYPPDFPWGNNVPPWRIEDTIKLIGSHVHSFSEFLTQFAAPSHGNGVLKFFSNASSPTIFEWNSANGWRSDWTKWRNRLIVFAYDWSGSLFGFDSARKKSGELP